MQISTSYLFDRASKQMVSIHSLGGILHTQMGLAHMHLVIPLLLLVIILMHEGFQHKLKLQHHLLVVMVR